MDILEALQWRYAVKRFTSETIEDADIRTLLEATRLSPSGYGLQPYKILVVTDQKIRHELLPHSYGQEKVAESSHLIVIAVDKDIGDHTVDRYIKKHAETLGQLPIEFSGYANHMKSALERKTAAEKQNWAKNQAFIALGNLLTCAALMKIDSCPMTGFDVRGFDTVLDLHAQGLTSTVICPLGRRHPEDKNADLPKTRFDYHEMVVEV